MNRFVPLLSLALAGCASSGASPAVEGGTRQVLTRVETPGTAVDLSLTKNVSVHAVSLGVAPAAAWSALPQVYADLGLQVSMADPAAQTIGSVGQRTRRIGGRLPSRYFDCGRSALGEHADVYEVYPSVRTQLVPAEGGGTSARTIAEAMAKSRTSSSGSVQCASNGELETLVGQKLRERTESAAK